MTDSDSSGTLSSDGVESDNDDANLDPQISFRRDSILGGKYEKNRRMSTASSNFYSHYSDIGLNNNIQLIDQLNDDDDSDEEQLDAEQLLEQEHSKLNFFSESLNSCDKLAGKMTNVLHNLQDKLQKLQKTLDPIRRATKDVALAENNINKTINELKKVMEYHQLTIEPIANIQKKKLKASSGLTQNINDADADAYDEFKFDEDQWDDPFLNWIEKINEAKDYFEINKFKSSKQSIDKLKNIASIALNKMEGYFRDLLKQHTTRNKWVINQIIEYKLMDNWKQRNVQYPLWINKLYRKKNKNNNNNRGFNSNNAVNDNETDLLYIPYRVIKLLSNVASRIESTSVIHKLPDKLGGNLIIQPRSNLLTEILKSLNNENLLTIMYIHAYYQTAMKNKANHLFKNKKQKNNDIAIGLKTRKSLSLHDDDDDGGNNDNNKGNNPFVLSADALDKLNTMHKIADKDDMDADIIAIAIDIQSQSHPIILLLHISLSLFQLERYLCSMMLDLTEKYNILLEFDEFFNQIIASPLQLIIEKVENVLKVKDIMDVTRNANLHNSKKSGRRVSFNQLSSFANPNIPIEEAAKITAKNTAKAAIVNDSIHKNMVLVKLDLVSTWMKLYPQFDRVLNLSQEYGANNNDNDNDNNNGNVLDNNNKDISINKLIKSGRCMVYLSGLGNKLYLNCKETLEGRIDKIKNHRELKNVRSDGGYHPLTIETVKLMFGIYKFKDALQHLYDTQTAISAMKILVNNVDDDNKDNNNHIMKRAQIEKTLLIIIKALRRNLHSKAGQYGNNRKTLESIFMLNNLHYIVKTIVSTPLEQACGQPVIVSLRKDIDRYKKEYEKYTWNKIKEFINISKVRFTSKKIDLNTKEKKPIKQRFNGFNKEFNDILNTQKYYSIPDTNLRTELINRNIDTVLPMYRNFLSRFKDIEFTKDKGKYLKYDDKTLHEKMHSFFMQN